jgi:hypothetical protein
MKTAYISSTLTAALFTMGCAGVAAPTDHLARAQAAVRASEEIGASKVPQAELHQTLAKEQLEKARKLMEDDENEAAKSALQRAKADAELALALTREHKAKEDAERADAALRAARQQSAGQEMASGSGASN